MQTVYQVSWFNMAAEMLPGLCFVVISTLVWIFWLRRERGFRRVYYFICWMIVMAIGSCWLVVVIRTGHQYRTALQTGQCRVVEGTVSVLHKDAKGHAETIQVGTEEFSYSDDWEDYDARISYHWIIRNGGPLTNGAYARLHVLDEDGGDTRILKVEIRH